MHHVTRVTDPRSGSIQPVWAASTRLRRSAAPFDTNDRIRRDQTRVTQVDVRSEKQSSAAGNLRFGLKQCFFWCKIKFNDKFLRFSWNQSSTQFARVFFRSNRNIFWMWNIQLRCSIQKILAHIMGYIFACDYMASNLDPKLLGPNELARVELAWT